MVKGMRWDRLDKGRGEMGEMPLGKIGVTCVGGMFTWAVMGLMIGGGLLGCVEICCGYV